MHIFTQALPTNVSTVKHTSAREWSAMQPHSSVCINCYFQHWLMHKTLITVCPDSRLMHCRFSIVQPTVQTLFTDYPGWQRQAANVWHLCLKNDWIETIIKTTGLGEMEKQWEQKKISSSSKLCCVTFQLLMVLVSFSGLSLDLCEMTNALTNKCQRVSLWFCRLLLLITRSCCAHGQSPECFSLSAFEKN